MKVLSNKAKSLVFELINEVDRSPIDMSRIRNIDIDSENYKENNKYMIVEFIGIVDGEEIYELAENRLVQVSGNELDEMEEKNEDLIIIKVKYNIKGEDY